MEYRTLSRVEIAWLAHLDRTETIEYVYHMEDGELRLKRAHYDVSDWGAASKQERIADLQATYDQGATFYGGLDGDVLAGMAVLTHTPLATGDGRLNLYGLWVSRRYRGQGVGRTLVQQVIAEARERGGKTLYVSATPSQNTIRFYRSLGFQPAALIDPTLFALEPEDIHMTLPL